MASHILIRYNDNWADEMDINGFVVILDSDWDKIKDLMRKLFERGQWTFGIGTNEEIEYNSFAEWERTLTLTSLTQDDAATFISTCQRSGMRKGYEWKSLIIDYGFFPLPWKDRFTDQDEEKIEVPEGL